MQRNGLVFDLLDRDRQWAIPLERRMARQHVIRGHAQRIDIATSIQRPAFDLFGAHVERRPHRDPNLR